MYLEAKNPRQIALLQEFITIQQPSRITVQLDLPVNQSTLLAIAKNDLWPHAINPQNIITEGEGAKIARAATILSDLVRLQPDKKFLDYGCGQGHVPAEAARRGNHATGYDPTPQKWEQYTNKINLTNDLDMVHQNAPYDIILCYDVLDYMPDGQVQVLQNIHDLLAPDGYAYIHCHPYTSAHGAGLYTTLNLAYAHLVLEPEDIRSLGGNIGDSARIIKPIDSYQKWIQEAGFRVNREVIHRTTPPAMFNDPGIVDFLINRLYGPNDGYVKNAETLYSILSIDHVNYDLAHH